MIAVTFALPEESKDLRRELRDVRHAGRSKAGPTLSGYVRGIQVVLCHTGMGQEEATRETRTLIGEHRPSLLISSGYAGALSPSLKVGDVVFDGRDTAHKGLDSFASGCFSGRIHTHGQALEHPDEKAALGRQTGSLAVDMETAGIASVCAEIGVPVVGIRGISDAMDDPLPVPMAHWFDHERQRPRPLGLMLYLAKNPRAVRPFARFVGGLPSARRAMTRAIIIFLEEFSESRNSP